MTAKHFLRFIIDALNLVESSQGLLVSPWDDLQSDQM